MKRRLWFVLLLALSLPLFLFGFSSPKRPHAAISSPAQIHFNSNYGKLPLAFEPNQGQADPQVKFLARGSGYTLFVTSQEAVLSLKKPKVHPTPLPGKMARSKISTLPTPDTTPPTVLRVKMEGVQANQSYETLEQLPGISNYFSGKDPAQWHTNIHQYSKVAVRGIYPGVDMVYYGNQRKLEYDFIVAPGADSTAIHMRVEGAQNVQVNDQGDMELQTPQGKVVFRAPTVYQEIKGQRNKLEGHYKLEVGNRVGFEVKNYDRTQPLVIDPQLDYSTYLGGTGYDQGNAIAVDGSGNAYVTGETYSTDFPTTAGAYQPGPGSGDAIFVTEVNAAGTNVIYSTFLGVAGSGNGISVDSSGNAYVTGYALASFPTTSGAYQPVFGGAYNAFITKLNSSGSSLLYSTYLGGNQPTLAYGIAIDTSGNAYITGFTEGSFPTTSGAYQTVFSGSEAVFMVKLNPAGGGTNDLVYSTLLGSNGFDQGRGIAVDSSGYVYLTGFTSGGFPTTSGAYQTSSGGENNVFVAKLNPANAGTSDLIYSTYLGGIIDDEGYGIALDSSGNAYVTGFTEGSFPTTSGAAQTVFSGGAEDAFISKLNSSGSSLLYSTYLGGSNGTLQEGYGIVVDSAGNAYVTGDTNCTDFPTTADAYQSVSGGGLQAFVLMLNPMGNGANDILYSTFLGDSSGSVGFGITLDSSSNAYVTGWTGGTFPTTAGAAQSVYGGGSGDVFISKFDVSAFYTPTPCGYPGNTCTFTYTSTSTSTFTNTPTITPTFTATPSNTPTNWTPNSTPSNSVFIGNQSVFATNNSFALNNSLFRGSVRFTARSNMTIGTVDLYFDSSANSPQYRVEIQGDNGGVPNGTYLSAPSTFTPYAGSNGIWQSISLGASVNLISGVVYHIVVEPVNVNATQYSVWRQSSVPGTQLYPRGQQADANMGIAQDQGSGWGALAGYQPIFVLRDASFNVLDGNPYAVEADLDVYGTNQLAERFVVNGVPLRIKTVGAYIKTNGAPTGNLNWQIQNVTTGSIITGGILATPSQVTSSYGWVETTIPSTLLPVGIYRYILISPGSSLGSDYQWNLAGESKTSDNSNYSSITYGKDQAFGEIYSGGTWINVSYPSYPVDNDFGFRMQVDNSATPTPTPTATPNGASVIGNQSVFLANNDIILNDMTVRGSERFAARSSMTVGAIDLYFDSSTNSPQYRVGFQGDNGGVPNGTYLSAPTTFSVFASNNWQSISLTSSASLASGMVYHIVVEPVSVNARGYAIWRQSSVPGTQLYPRGQQADANMGIAQDMGSGWGALVGYQPIFALRNTSLIVADGNPYAVEADQDIYGTNCFGQRFVVNGVPLRIKTAGSFIRANGTPTGNLNWQIQNVTTGNIVAGGILATPSQVTSSYQWVETSIPSTLLPVGLYRFVLKSSSSSLGNDYQWSLAGSWIIGPAGNYTSITYGKDQAFGENSPDGGTSWNNYFSNSLSDADFGFRMQVDTSATPTPTPTATPNGAIVIGNQSVFLANNDIILNDMTVRGSERFAARSSMMVGAIDLYFDSSTNSPQYRVGFQGDNGGVPNGTYLSAPTTFSVFASNNWQSISLTSSANLASGMVYHIVVEPVYVSGTNYAIWRQSSVPGTQLYPQGQQADVNMGIVQDMGKGWGSVAGYQPIFVLRNTSFMVLDGNPYAVEADQDIYGNNLMSQRFTPSALYIVNSVGAYIRKVGSPITALTWTVQTLSGTTVASGIFATASQVGANYQWLDITVTPFVLPTTTCRFILSSGGSSLGNDYQWSLAGSTLNVIGSYSGITYDGSNSFGENSSNGGSAWNSYFPSNISDDDFGFRLWTNGATPTLTPSSTATVSPTNTPTQTSTNSPTVTPTVTPTNSATLTPTASLTSTTTNSPTDTPTNTPTDTPTNTPSNTPTNSPTDTPTNSPTDTPTNSPTNTPTSSPTPSPTDTPTNSPTNTPTPTPTNTNTATNTPTNTPTSSPTNSPTNTPTNSPTNSPTSTPTNTLTKTPTLTPTNSFTRTATNSPTRTPTNSPTKTPTLTVTKTATNSPTKTPTNTATKTPTVTRTPTRNTTPTKTPTKTNTPTKTPTRAPGGKAIIGIETEVVPSATFTPTPQELNGLLNGVVAAPNISRDGDPVHFKFNLAKSAAIHLALFALTGERVYQTQAQGTAGANNLLWNLQNSAGSNVSSGLYIYVLTADDGATQAQVIGKVAILH